MNSFSSAGVEGVVEAVVGNPAGIRARDGGGVADAHDRVGRTEVDPLDLVADGDGDRVGRERAVAVDGHRHLRRAGPLRERQHAEPQNGPDRCPNDRHMPERGFHGPPLARARYRATPCGPQPPLVKLQGAHVGRGPRQEDGESSPIDVRPETIDEIASLPSSPVRYSNDARAVILTGVDGLARGYGYEGGVRTRQFDRLDAAAALWLVDLDSSPARSPATGRRRSSTPPASRTCRSPPASPSA